MIAWQKDEPGTGSNVHADGVVTIEQAAELKAALVDALASAESVFLDMAGVTEADVTCIQLLCSACRSAGMQDKKLGVTGMSGYLYSTAAKGGFGSTGCGTAPCLWRQGGLHE